MTTRTPEQIAFATAQLHQGKGRAFRMVDRHDHSSHIIWHWNGRKGWHTSADMNFGPNSWSGFSPEAMSQGESASRYEEISLFQWTPELAVGEGL